MLEEIVIAGFGGQGVIFAGRLLCEAALAEGKQVACAVSYGPEMRGGTANCSVIISDEPIGSLVVNRPTVAVVMNEPSLAKFEPRVKESGLLIVNRSLVSHESRRQDIQALYIPATELALHIGNKAVANLVLIGALVAVRPVVSAQAVMASLVKILPRFIGAGLVAINQQAFHMGLEQGKATDVVTVALRR